jgi:hypothetical protein
MLDVLKALVKQPYWAVALILGAALVAFPCVTIDKDNHWATHPPSTLVPVSIGIALLLPSSAAFGLTLVWSRPVRAEEAGAGPDLTRVHESDGVLSATAGSCEIRVVQGRIEDCVHASGAAIVLPCNEYFDDHCVNDTRSALGAYVNRVFDGQVTGFVSLIRDECKRKLGAGTEQQKTDDERATSFGPGHCLLLIAPLGRSNPVALVSTTTQRAGEGLAARISYLFEGMHRLVSCLADARLNEVAMPVLGAGHGGIDTPLALVGLLLAVAEATRYGRGRRPLRKVTIVVFRKDANSPADVDQAVVRRALALVGSRG